MRDIKFRVWDKENKKFFKPIYEAYKGNLLDLSICLDGSIMRRTLAYPAEHESNFSNKYELSQFTGLKDKNGVDIYEGDILDTGWVISFKDGMFGVFDINRHMGFNSYTSQYREVIGNIHENPELLC